MKQIAAALFASAFMMSAAMAADTGWVSPPARSFDGHAVHVDDIVGILHVEVKPVAKVQVRISGEKNRVDAVQVHVDGDTVAIRGRQDVRPRSFWDWRHWFGAHFTSESDAKKLQVQLVVPDKTPLDVSDFIGKADIGSTHASLHFEGTAVEPSVAGDVGDAKISISGSGKIRLGDVAGALDTEIAGSGDISAKSAGQLHSEIAGSGSVSVGDIRGGLNSEIAGSGNVSAASVHGAVHVEISGSGSVKIKDGKADPFHVEIMGAGDVRFGGVAHAPHVEAMGSGNVWIKSYTGKLNSSGNAHVRTGE